MIWESLRDAYGVSSGLEWLLVLAPPFVLSAAIAGKLMAQVSRRRRMRLSQREKQR